MCIDATGLELELKLESEDTFRNGKYGGLNIETYK